MTAKELRSKRATLATDIRRLADLANKENRDFTAEEKSNWEKVNADYNALTRQIELQERAEAVEQDQRARADVEPPPGREDTDTRTQGGEGRGGRAEVTEETRALAIQSWVRSLCDMDLEERHTEACRATGFNPHRRRMDLRLLPTSEARKFQDVYRDVHSSRVQRSLSAIALNLGGITVPETLIRALETNMLAFGGVLQVAEIMRTATGEKISWPTADDTSNSGEQVGESAGGGTTSTDPSFGAVTWDAHKFSSKNVLVPHELLEDSAFNLVAWLGAALGERLGRILATKCTTGNGAGTAKGIVTASTAGPTAASASAIAADEIFDLVHSVNPAYRTSDCGFLMHDNIVLALRKLKDGNGAYLWQSGMASGAPDRLAGYPLTVSMEMASSIASGAKTVLFGQLRKYKVREVGAIRMYRLQERFRDNDQDGFVAFLRADGNLLDAGTAPVKHLVH